MRPPSWSEFHAELNQYLKGDASALDPFSWNFMKLVKLQDNCGGKQMNVSDRLSLSAFQKKCPRLHVESIRCLTVEPHMRQQS